VASDIKEHILKLASKIAVLSNDGVISKSEMSSIVHSLRQLFRLLVKSMYRPPPSASAAAPSSSSCHQEESVHEILELFLEFHTVTLEIISPHMSSGNSSRLTSLLDFFRASNGQFLQLLLFSEEYSQEKNQIKSFAKFLPPEFKKQSHAGAAAAEEGKGK
jgi:hypothetical protein